MTDEEGIFVAFGVYVYLILATIISTVSLLIIILLMHHLEHLKIVDYCMLLKIYFLSMVIACGAVFQHSFYMLVNWSHPTSYNFHPLFYTGLIDHSLLCAVPSSVFYLTLDKCLILFFKQFYQENWRRDLITASLVTMLGLGMLNGISTASNVTWGIVPDNCTAYGCIMTRMPRLVYTVSKLTVLCFNMSVGLVYIMGTVAFRKRFAGFPKKEIGQKIVTRILVYELLFDFIPHIVDLCFLTFRGSSPMTKLGPFGRVIFVTDVLFTSLTNAMTLVRKYRTLKCSPVATTATKLSHSHHKPLHSIMDLPVHPH